MLPAAAHALPITAGLWTAMSAIAMALSAFAAVAVFLADRRAKARAGKRTDADGDAHLMEVERQGWEMLLTNMQNQYAVAQQSLVEAREALRKTQEDQGWQIVMANLRNQYAAAQQSLMEAQDALDRTRLELRKTQERLRQVEKRLAERDG